MQTWTVTEGLLNICKKNATLLNQNIEVLSLYPEEITIKVISKLCSASEDNDSFELVNALTDKDVSKAIGLSRKMMMSGDNDISIIYLLATQYRFLYYVAYLTSIGKRNNEIIEIAKCSEYRLDKARQTLSKLKMNQIMNLLSQLSDIDIQTKTDYNISDSDRFELFILDLMKRV